MELPLLADLEPVAMPSGIVDALCSRVEDFYGILSLYFVKPHRNKSLEPVEIRSQLCTDFLESRK